MVSWRSSEDHGTFNAGGEDDLLRILRSEHQHAAPELRGDVFFEHLEETNDIFGGVSLPGSSAAALLPTDCEHRSVHAHASGNTASTQIRMHRPSFESIFAPASELGLSSS